MALSQLSCVCILRNSGLWGKWVNKLCFLLLFRSRFCRRNARKVKLLEVLWPRHLEIRLSNLKIPLLTPPLLVSLFPLVGHGRSQLVSASSHPQLGSDGQLLARLGQPRGCGCRFYIRCCPILDETWWLTWIRITDFLAQFPQRENRGRFFQQLHFNKHVQITDIFCCLFCCTGRTFCRHNNWWILWCSNRFLLFWNQIAFTHHKPISTWIPLLTTSFLEVYTR